MAVPIAALVIIVTLAATREYQSVIAEKRYDWLGPILSYTSRLQVAELVGELDYAENLGTPDSKHHFC